MSRGPGTLQKTIIDELMTTPGTRLPWEELKRRFPRESAQHSLHRAVRGLLNRGLVYSRHVGKRHYLGLTVSGDAKLSDLCNAAHAQLEAVAKARSVPVPPLVEPASPSTSLGRRGLTWTLNAGDET